MQRNLPVIRKRHLAATVRMPFISPNVSIRRLATKRVSETCKPGERLDYESELAVIIRKDAYCVSEKDAKDYIFGYTVINDVSARDVQTRHQQWYFGKSLDGFLPMGPCIVSADEIAYPAEAADPLLCEW